MRVISEDANKCKKEKYSVCTVCTLRNLRFGVTDSWYSNVTCSVRNTG